MTVPSDSEATAALPPKLREALACPRCGSPLTGDEHLDCPACGASYPTDHGVVRLIPPELRERDDTSFYDQDADNRHGRDQTTIVDALRLPVERFAAGLAHDALVVELGSGRGAFDQIHPGYVALDISFAALATHSTGARIQAHAEALPFADGSVDALFTVAALEHVPRPGRALAEIERCLRPGGSALIFPAWYVRPWVGRALHLRPYSELGPRERLSKASIPIRNRREYQFGVRLPNRLLREAAIAAGRKLPFRYRRLQPNLETYVTSDSDAFSSMDPHAASAYFVSRGWHDLARPSAVRRLTYAYEPVVVQKPG